MSEEGIKIPEWVKTAYQFDAYIQLLRMEFDRQQVNKAHPFANQRQHLRPLPYIPGGPYYEDGLTIQHIGQSILPASKPPQ